MGGGGRESGVVAVFRGSMERQEGTGAEL